MTKTEIEFELMKIVKEMVDSLTQMQIDAFDLIDGEFKEDGTLDVFVPDILTTELKDNPLYVFFIMKNVMLKAYDKLYKKGKPKND